MSLSENFIFDLVLSFENFFSYFKTALSPFFLTSNKILLTIFD